MMNPMCPATGTSSSSAGVRPMPWKLSGPRPFLERRAPRKGLRGVGQVHGYPGPAADGRRTTRSHPPVVRVCPQAAHYDPTVHDDPLKFDIHRTPKNIIFGCGPHLCVGMHFARQLLRLAVERMINRFPNARLVDPQMEFGIRRLRGRAEDRLPADVHPLGLGDSRAAAS